MSKACLKCGAANSDTARFCSDCAAPLEMACPSCGVVNRPEARFCSNCATLLRGPTPQTGMLPPNSLLLGRYVILRRVGGGGMGAVYQATDQRIAGKLWAVKEMSDAALTSPLDKQRAVDAFRREAQLLATLDHGNLPKVSDFFTESGKHYLVMDFIQGQTLEQALGQTSGFLPESQVTDWALQLCDVLAYLHRRQPPIIFRDLKPANIMLDAEGRIKLIDFGIARAFQPGKSTDTQAMGTPGYAAPEQYGVGQSDARSDVYALGVTLHRLLTRYDPALSPFNLPPPRNVNATLSQTVAAVIIQATQPDGTARFQTVTEMRQALVNRQTSVQIPVVPSPLVRPTASADFVRPYVLAPGLIATTPEELAQVCERDWDRAVSQFCSGYFETWLRQMHQYGLADDAQKIVARVKNGAPTDRGTGLLEWLALTGYAGRGVVGIIGDLDYGAVGLGESATVTLAITNTGSGYLLGTARSQVPWLTIACLQFACGQSGSVQIGVTVNTAGLSPGLLTDSRAVLVETKTDRKVIGVKVNVMPPVLHVQPASLDCGGIKKEQTWKGMITISNNGRGILEGIIQSNAVWLNVGRKFRCAARQQERVEAVINPGGLTPGRVYQTELTVTSNGGTQRIPVTARVIEAPPPLPVTLFPPKLEFGRVPKGSTKKIHVSIVNTGTQNIAGTALSNVLWVKADQRFHCPPEKLDVVVITLDTTGLTPGQSYYGELTISDLLGVQVIPMSVMVI